MNACRVSYSSSSSFSTIPTPPAHRKIHSGRPVDFFVSASRKFYRCPHNWKAGRKEGRTMVGRISTDHHAASRGSGLVHCEWHATRDAILHRMALRNGVRLSVSESERVSVWIEVLVHKSYRVGFRAGPVILYPLVLFYTRRDPCTVRTRTTLRQAPLNTCSGLAFPLAFPSLAAGACWNSSRRLCSPLLASLLQREREKSLSLSLSPQCRQPEST